LPAKWTSNPNADEPARTKLSLLMRTCHAAALMLVGWYLMVPVRFPNPTVNPCLPLSQWTIFESFDTAAKCERKLRRLSLEEVDSDIKAKPKKRSMLMYSLTA
jgi:hypothetical protein